MKFFKILAIAFLAFIVLFFVVGIFLPKTGDLEKTYEIKAAADVVKSEIITLYQDHMWPIWSFEDTSVVFTDIDDGYSWNGDAIGGGECHYVVSANSISDHITIKGKDMAETVWSINGSDPVELTINFKVFAGGNIGARWTNLFLNNLVGDDIDKLVKSVKDKVEM